MPHSLLISIAAVAVPVLIMVLLRINASMVFLSLCLGTVLVQYVASQANDLVKMISPHAGNFSVSTIQLAMLLLPATATAVLTMISVHGRIRGLLNIVPAVAASLFAMLLAVPLLTPGMRNSVEKQGLWQTLSRAEALVVGVGALVSLVFLWSQRGSFRRKDKEKRGH